MYKPSNLQNEEMIVTLPKKCYEADYVLEWKVVEYNIEQVVYSYTEGITQIKCSAPHIHASFTRDDFYKTIFFTKEEAEKALKVIKERENNA